MIAALSELFRRLVIMVLLLALIAAGSAGLIAAAFVAWLIFKTMVLIIITVLLVAGLLGAALACCEPDVGGEGLRYRVVWGTAALLAFSGVIACFAPLARLIAP